MWFMISSVKQETSSLLNLSLLDESLKGIPMLSSMLGLLKNQNFPDKFFVPIMPTGTIGTLLLIASKAAPG
ncbi:MAG: hypothetical protein A2158_06530 [Chloroflexi bacterium RBG_13_46_14]|nr:MAG: hypothetical protein A2158_06530 [Chloroflexi bacterium RBG_13_46_14]